MSQKITCVSLNGATLDVVDLGLTFAPGESQDVTDDQAAVLLKSPQFVDSSGKNPTFACMICAKPSYDEFTRVGNDMVHLVSDDGKRTCLACFENRLEHPTPTPEPISDGEPNASKPPASAVVPEPPTPAPSEESPTNHEEGA